MQVKFRLGLLAILLGLSFGLGWALQASTQEVPPPVTNAAIVFNQVRPVLRRTNIPLRLPTYIPKDLNTEPNYEPPPIQVALPEQPSSKGYEVILGFSSNCSGGNACRFGTVTGRLKPTQSIPGEYAWIQSYQGRKSKEPLQKVRLTNNIEGWFIPWTCGANCSDAKVVWDEYSYRYSVGIKVGDKGSLIKMANSAITDIPQVYKSFY